MRLNPGLGLFVVVLLVSSLNLSWSEMPGSWQRQLAEPTQWLFDL